MGCVGNYGHFGQANFRQRAGIYFKKNMAHRPEQCPGGRFFHQNNGRRAGGNAAVGGG